MESSTLEDRLWSRYVIDENGCWVWSGKATFPGGYGRIRTTTSSRDTPERAHRVAYRLAYGAFSEALDVLHACDNPPCINPEHLRLGTAKDNIQDAIRKNRIKPDRQSHKTHCVRGHGYDGDNLITDKRGWRKCRACERSRQAAAYQRKKKDSLFA